MEAFWEIQYVEFRGEGRLYLRLFEMGFLEFFIRTALAVFLFGQQYLTFASENQLFSITFHKKQTFSLMFMICHYFH